MTFVIDKNESVNTQLSFFWILENVNGDLSNHFKNSYLALFPEILFEVIHSTWNIKRIISIQNVHFKMKKTLNDICFQHPSDTRISLTEYSEFRSEPLGVKMKKKKKKEKKKERKKKERKKKRKKNRNVYMFPDIVYLRVFDAF